MLGDIPRSAVLSRACIFPFYVKLCVHHLLVYQGTVSARRYPSLPILTALAGFLIPPFCLSVRVSTTHACTRTSLAQEDAIGCFGDDRLDRVLTAKWSSSAMTPTVREKNFILRAEPIGCQTDVVALLLYQ